MIRHTILLIFRNFIKYKSTFFINLIGLSSGLACVLMIYLWVNDELKMDKFHEKDSQLYQVMERGYHSNEITTSSSTPGPLGEALAKEMPEVELATTIPDGFFNKSTLNANDKLIKASGQYASKDYFNIFSFDLLQGNRERALSDRSSIVISESVALKLFQTTHNIIGKTIEFQHEKQYQITGIFKDVPSNSSIQFEFVLPYEEFLEKNQWALTWGNHNPRTYLVLKKGTDIKHFNKKIEDFIKSKFPQTDVKLFVRPFSDGYLYDKYENGVLVGGRIEYIKLFSLVAIFILAIACINFMNLSTAKASRRLKEVGIKKAIGANRSSLIFQYLGESILIAFTSLAVALILVILFLPQFNHITGKNLSIDLEVVSILSVLGITFVTGILSGSYPALYLSGFNTIAVLKGKLKNSVGELFIRKGLVVFQFAISVIFILAVFVIYQQMKFIQTKNLGYSKDNIIYFVNEGKIAENPETFVEEINKIPGVESASSIRHLLSGHMNTTSDFKWEGKLPEENIEFEHIGVRLGMIEMLKIKFKEGRPFLKEYGTDTSSIIFNEAAIKIMGLKDPIGKKIILHGKEMQVIGVTENFHFQSLHESFHPAFFRLTPRAPWFIMAKIETGKEKQVIPALQKFYEQYNPGFSFDYKFLDEEYQTQYESEQKVASLSKYFAVLAILISCLGLFGLAAFSAEKRLKEIGIRKVLGSSTINIIYLLSGDFTKLVFVSIIIALPISYLLAKKWLQSFAFGIELQWWYFPGAGIVSLLIAWFTVSSQAFKAARTNPVKCLKDE